MPLDEEWHPRDDSGLNSWPILFERKPGDAGYNRLCRGSYPRVGATQALAAWQSERRIWARWRAPHGTMLRKRASTVRR